MCARRLLLLGKKIDRKENAGRFDVRESRGGWTAILQFMAARTSLRAENPPDQGGGAVARDEPPGGA